MRVLKDKLSGWDTEKNEDFLEMSTQTEKEQKTAVRIEIFAYIPAW